MPSESLRGHIGPTSMAAASLTIFLDDNVADNEICIEEYTTVKKNRNRHGGGVILYPTLKREYSKMKLQT